MWCCFVDLPLCCFLWSLPLHGEPLLHYYGECKAWIRDIKWLNEAWIKSEARHTWGGAILRGMRHRNFFSQSSTKAPWWNGNSSDWQVFIYAAANVLHFHVEVSSDFISRIFGFVARDTMMNDSVFNLCIHAIADTVKDCLVLRSFLETTRWPSLPKTKIPQTEFVLIPVHLSDIYLGLLLSTLFMGARNLQSSYTFTSRQSRIIINIVWRDHGQKVRCPSWKSGIKKAANPGHFHRLVSISNWIITPRQPDGRFAASW